MRKRAADIGAELDIKTEAKSGTQVLLSLDNHDN